MSSKTPEGAVSAAPFWVLLLQRGDPGVLYEAIAMAASAISLGLDVTLIWFDTALEALVSGALAADAGEPRSVDRLFREARESGHLRCLACSGSMVGSRLAPEAVRAVVDDLVGWPTAISLIRAAERSFVW